MRSFCVFNQGQMLYFFAMHERGPLMLSFLKPHCVILLREFPCEIE